ncbi:mitochondrial ribosomal protein L48 [Lasioglossum baleicum]|uniref:mitochondrial ribosomal protein L48 n=1 Tax=Lasioglossum baleicum TaxID=434251 RepID=UPI003FCC809A
MALNLIKQVSTCCRRRLMNTSMRFYGLYDPPYLSVKHKGPALYPVLNIQIKGYVYPLLEKYQSLICKIANELDVDVEDSYAFPHQELKVERYKKQSEIVDADYNLRIFERDMVVSNITSTKIPILIRLLEATLPVGVSLHVDTYKPEIETKRYVPDKELFDLKTELDEMKNPNKQ